MQPANRDQRLNEMIKKIQNGSMRMSEKDAVAVAGRLFSNRRYKQTENVCSQLLKHRPTSAVANSLLGLSLLNQGKIEKAIEPLQRATKLAPEEASYFSNLGEVYRQTGDLKKAKVALEKAIKLKPENAQAHNNLGIVFYDNGDFDAAEKSYRRALELNPKFAEAYNNLGNALRRKGDVEAAVNAYQDALAVRANYPEAYNNLGTQLRELGKLEQAEHALRKATQLNPRYVDAYNNLAELYVANQKETDALRQLSEALKVDPKNVRSLVLTARIQSRRENFAAAEQACRRALGQEPDNAAAKTVLGMILHETDRYEEAVKLLEEVLKKDPKNAEAISHYGIALKSVGRLDEAREALLKGLEINPNMYGAYANLNDLIDFSKEKAVYERLEAIVEGAGDLRPEYRIPLHYAYAKALDDHGRSEEALQHYMEGGRLKRAQLSYDEAQSEEFFTNIKKMFPREIFANRPFKGDPTDRLLFIVGMPRSGSTLVEQIVSSHKEIYGAGEVKYLSRSLHQLRDRFPSLSRYPEMVGEINETQWNILAESYKSAIFKNSEDAKIITDKLLTNYFFVGLINILFPNAKIINTQRNPVDTCLSTFTKLFKDDMPHSYDLGELGRYYLQYDRLMRHWQEVLPDGVIKTVNYEDVVKDTEAVARELIDFVGLKWDPACVDFHNSKRPVKTASVAQVRKPIYNTAVDRWRKYGDGLKPLVDILGDLQPKVT